MPAPPDISADVELLYKALAQLPRREREAVVLFEISGFSMKEIREIQGGSLSSVKVRVFRARKRLAELLGVSPARGGLPSGPRGRGASNREMSDPILIPAETNVLR
jgi:DNA-directed RNA polymerase specialized sigma24 family protein